MSLLPLQNTVIYSLHARGFMRLQFPKTILPSLYPWFIIDYTLCKPGCADFFSLKASSALYDSGIPECLEIPGNVKT